MLHLIRNAEIYTPEPYGLGHMIVCGSQIVFLGAKLPKIDKKLIATDTDMQGASVIPGLIDGHAHVTGGGGEAGYSTRVPAVSPSQFSRFGVTTIVGLLGTDDLIRTTSSLIAQTMALREEGLNAWCYTGGYHLPLTTLTGSAKSDIVHIECVLGVGEFAISDHRSSQPTFDEIVKIASEAHVAGLMSGKAGIVHFHLGDGSRGLSLIEAAIAKTELPARVFNPTHVNRKKALFEQACKLAELGATIDITSFPVEEGEDAWSAEDAWKIYQQKELPPDRITISSDSGGCLPKFDKSGQIVSLDYGSSQTLLETLTSLTTQGVPLHSALPAMTSNPAKLLKLKGKGVLTPGGGADLVVLDDDYKIRHVMVRGTWHVTDHEVTQFGKFE